MKTIENPKATIPFLRYQIGEIITRNEITPVYSEFKNDQGEDDYKLIGHRELDSKVTVFNLLAFGETKQQAERMLANRGK